MINFTDNELHLLYETCLSMRNLCDHLGADKKVNEYQHIIDKVNVEMAEKEYTIDTINSI